MTTPKDDILRVAQRLDDLSDEEGLGELAELSATLGDALAALERDLRRSASDGIPRWMREVQEVVERHNRDIYRDTERRNYIAQRDMHLYSRMSIETHSPHVSLAGFDL